MNNSKLFLFNDLSEIKFDFLSNDIPKPCIKK